MVRSRGRTRLSQFIQLLILAQLSSPTSGCELGAEAAGDSPSLHSFRLHSHSQKNPKQTSKPNQVIWHKDFQIQTPEVQSTIWVGTPEAPTPRRKITRNPQKLTLLRAHHVTILLKILQKRVLSHPASSRKTDVPWPLGQHTLHLKSSERATGQDYKNKSSYRTKTPPVQC